MTPERFLPTPDAGVVIVGAGQAGVQVAQSLHELGYPGPITLIGDEDSLPYQRPPLSKAVLLGDADAATVTTHPASWFDARGIAFQSASPVTGIDRLRRLVRLSDGSEIPYAQLVLATGARNRRLACQGGDAPGIHYLRTHAEAFALREALAGASSVAIVGAGFLGLEAAGCATAMGKQVYVIDVADRVLSCAVSPAVSAAVEMHHRKAGVRFLLGQSVQSFRRDGAAVSVLTAPHGAVAADMVLVAIGVVPNSELAEGAGLAVSNGITVDHRLRTSDPAVWAIGDCACFVDETRGGPMRIESVQNAMDQGRYVAERIMGSDGRYDRVPLFWSDQGGLRLQMAGIASPADAAFLRGDEQVGVFSVFHTRDGALVAVESVNDPRGHMLARKLLAAHASIPADALADSGSDLKSFLTGGIGKGFAETAAGYAD